MKERQEKKHRGVYEKLLGSGEWWIRFADEAGHIERKKVGTKSAAIALYGKMKNQVREKTYMPENFRKTVRFSELADDVLEYSKAHKLSYDHDVYRMASLKEAFGTRSAGSITPQDFERWIAEHEEWAPATANRYRALLSLTYRLGVKNNKVSQNPARLMSHRRENNARVRWLAPDEETKLRKAIGAEHLPELDIAIHTGLRRSEQYRLHAAHVIFQLCN